MTNVTRVFLDHVDEEPSQARRLAVSPAEGGWLVEAAAGDSLGDKRPGAGHGVLPERHQLLRTVVRGRVPFPVRIGIPVHGVPWLMSVPAVQLDRERVVLDEG